MTAALTVLAAALAVSATDRLAMADRLFNRGDYAAARTEFRALKGSAEIPAAALDYRLLAAAHALGDADGVRAEADRFLREHPADPQTDRVRLFAALAETGAERQARLRQLDREEIPAEVRAEALYRLAEETKDPGLHARVVEVAPKGRFAPYSKLAYATSLLRSAGAAERRRGISLLMEIVYGPNADLAKTALYLAAVQSYREARYGEALSLLRRYAKAYPKDARAADVRRLTALSALMNGDPATALALVGEEQDESSAYVRTLASQRLNRKADVRRFAKKYLEDFPLGPNRKAVELVDARLTFEEALERDDAPAALAAARRCRSLSSAAADRLLLAWALERSGDAVAAEAECAQIARDFPGVAVAADALYRRAMSLLRREQWSAAELALAEALASERLAPAQRGSALYWRGLATVRLGHRAEGVRFLKDALAAGLSLDERREARLAIADEDLSAGRTNVAVAAYSELVREGALERMGAAKTLTVGRLLAGDEARSCAKALRANAAPEWRQAGAALLGDVEEAAGNLTAAAEAWRACLDEPCSTESAAPVSVKLGLYLVRDGRLAEAEGVFRRAVELNKGDVEARAAAYVGLARAASMKGDTEAARGYATVVTTLFEQTRAAAEAKEFLK